MSEPPAKPSRYVANGFPPVAWRVEWRHDTPKVVSAKYRSPPQKRDFQTQTAAEQFKQAMEASYRDSIVICVLPVHISRRKREAKYDARQRNIAAEFDWPLQRRPS
jgi:hypothetical protein